MECANSSCVERYKQEGYHSIHSHEMKLTVDQMGYQTTQTYCSSDFPGFQPMSSQHIGQHASAHQQAAASAMIYDTSQHKPGAACQQESHGQLTGGSSRSAFAEPRCKDIARSNQNVANTHGLLHPAVLLGSQSQTAQPLAVGESPAKLAEQNLARAAAVMRIMNARSSCSSSTTAGPSAVHDFQPAASPPSSPRGVTIVQGVVGNSLRHLQPWQLPQLGPGQQSLNASSDRNRSPVMQSTTHPLGTQEAQMLSSASNSPQQPPAQQQTTALAACPAPAAIMATAADAQGVGQGGMSPAGDKKSSPADLEYGHSTPQQQQHVMQQQHTGDSHDSNQKGNALPLTQCSVTSSDAMVEPACACAPPAQAVGLAGTAHLQQADRQLHPAGQQQTTRKTKGGWLSCCFGSPAVDEAASAITAAGPAVAVDSAQLPAQPRSSEVWGLAKDHKGPESVGAEKPGYIKAYCTEPPCQQPHQQAFDFTTGAATGPFIGLKAEPLKLESCSAGGVVSRVSSVGGAAYNPPGAFNPGVQGAAGSVGGAEALRRMSNSRRFSRQGSRMRSRTESIKESTAGPAAADGKPRVCSAAETLASESTAAPGVTQQCDRSLPEGVTSSCPTRRHSVPASGQQVSITAPGSPGGSSSSRPRTSGRSSAAVSDKLAPWADLNQQLMAKQNQHHRILKKQLEAEARLIQQQEQLKQQLELLRQIRSRTPSPSGKGLTGRKSSPVTSSPQKSIDDDAGHAQAAAAALGQTCARKPASSPRGGLLQQSGMRAERKAGDPARRCTTGVNDVVSTAVALGDLMSPYGREPDSARTSRSSGKRQSAAHLRCSKSKESTAAESSGRPFGFFGNSGDTVPVAGLLHAAGSCGTSNTAVKGSGSISCVRSKVTTKKPFILQIPGVNSPPVSLQQAASTSFTFSSNSNSGHLRQQQPMASKFKLPKGLISLSFKRKHNKDAAHRQTHKTVRSWHRSAHLLPKKPVVKYSSFKVAASMLTPESNQQQHGAPRVGRLVLISPSSGFNSRRIRSKLLNGQEGLKDQEVEGPEDEAPGMGIHQGSSSWSLHSHSSFAETGEYFADAADEETAGTAAAEPLQSPSCQLTLDASAYTAREDMASRAASARLSLQQVPGDSQNRQADWVGGHAKQHTVRASPASSLTAAGAAAQKLGAAGQPRRATIDNVVGRSGTVIGSSSRSPQQRGRASAGPGSRQQGSYAAVALAGYTRRATTGDLSSRGQKLHTMSRNSYLKFLKEGAGHYSAAAAAAKTAHAVASSKALTAVAADSGQRDVVKPESAQGSFNQRTITQDSHHQQQQQWMPSPRSHPVPEIVTGSRLPVTVRMDVGNTCGDSVAAAAAADLAAKEAAARIAALAVRSVTQQLSAAAVTGSSMPVDRLGLGKSGNLLTGDMSHQQQLASRSSGKLQLTVPAGNVGALGAVNEHLTPTSAAARAAAAAAVKAVAAAADARAAEAKAAADAAMLMGGARGSGFGEGLLEKFHGAQQQQPITQGMQAQLEQQQQMLQKLMIEQQMALLQQQLQQLEHGSLRK